KFPPGHARAMGARLRIAVERQRGSGDGAHIRVRADGALSTPAGIWRDRRSNGRSSLRDRHTGPAAVACRRLNRRHAVGALRRDRRDVRAGDASLAQNDGRALRQQWLDGEIEAWTRARSPDEVLAAMDKADVPASKIYSIRDIVADAHYAARAMIREITLADGSRLK